MDEDDVYLDLKPPNINKLGVEIPAYIGHVVKEGETIKLHFETAEEVLTPSVTI